VDASVTAALISGVGVIVVAWVGFLGSKKGTLSSAEANFRTTILEENAKLRQRVDGLEKRLSHVSVENSKLKVKLARLEEASSTEGGSHHERIERIL
jgi:predicted nuclease with TOPRIM domain